MGKDIKRGGVNAIEKHEPLVLSPAGLDQGYLGGAQGAILRGVGWGRHGTVTAKKWEAEFLLLLGAVNQHPDANYGAL